MLFLCKAILHSYHPDWQANSIACAAWDPYLFLELLDNCVESLNLGKLFSWLSFLCHVMISWEHLAWWLLPHELEDILCNCGTSSMLCSKSRAPTRRSPICPISFSEVNLPRTTFGGWWARKKVTRKASSSSSNDISIKSEYLSEVCTNRSQECNLFLICWHSVFTMVASLARKTRNVVNSSRAISQHLLQMKIIRWTLSSHTENGRVFWKRKPVLIYLKLLRMLD